MCTQIAWKTSQMSRLLFLLLFLLFQPASAVDLELQHYGPLDVGDLQVLLPRDVHVAIMKFETEEDFCLGIEATHLIDDKQIEKIRLGKCWIAGQFNLILKIEPVDDDQSWLRVGINSLASGATSAGNPLKIGRAFGASLSVQPNIKLSSELGEILDWRLNVSDGGGSVDHTIRISAILGENPDQIMGSGHNEIDWPD